MIRYMDDCKWHILKRRDTKEDISKPNTPNTKHIPGMLCLSRITLAVVRWTSGARMLTCKPHVRRHTAEKLYNITPLGARKPKKPPQEPWSHSSENFRRHNCFNLYIISDLVITYNAQYTIGYGGYLCLSGPVVVVVCALDGGDNGPWHCYRPFCGALWLWLPPNTAWNDRIYSQRACMHVEYSFILKNTSREVGSNAVGEVRLTRFAVWACG